MRTTLVTPEAKAAALAAALAPTAVHRRSPSPCGDNVINTGEPAAAAEVFPTLAKDLAEADIKPGIVFGDASESA